MRAEEITLRVADGRSVSVLLNATPIRSEKGQLASYMVTMQDMNALKETERLRAEFLGMVSHELRMPLTSIRGAATTLLDAAADLDPAEMRQFHRIIVDQADHMRQLIEDLLDVARIETGTLPVDPEPAEVAALVDRARNAFTSAGGRNNLEIDVGADLPLVMADRRRIVQVIGNLLSNAARHSPEDVRHPRVRVREGGHVEVSVADQGRGIPAEDLPRLFRKFFRPGGPRDGRRHGPGPRHLQGDSGGPRGPHPGRERRAGPGGGSSSPCRLCRTEPARRPARSQDGGQSAGTVLVVDDDPMILRSVRDASPPRASARW